MTNEEIAEFFSATRPFIQGDCVRCVRKLFIKM